MQSYAGYQWTLTVHPAALFCKAAPPYSSDVHNPTVIIDVYYAIDKIQILEDGLLKEIEGCVQTHIIGEVSGNAVVR